MYKGLIQKLISGPGKERENAAREICQRRMMSLESDLIELLGHGEKEVREYAVIILGVIGSKDAIGKINELSKNDPATDVRIAAIITREYAGKITYDHLIAEIRRFRSTEHAEQEKDTSPDMSAVEEESKALESGKKARPSVMRVADLERKEELESRRLGVSFFGYCMDLFGKNKLRAASLFTAVVIIGGIAVFFLMKGEVQEEQAVRQRSVADVIKERITAIDKFKRNSLDPNNPESMYPRTLELRTMTGDTYGTLFESVYSNVYPTEKGMNTLGAFWRHINFGTGRKQNEIDLMDQETVGELLLFPNFAAFNILLLSEEGSVAYQGLNKNDPDLEIRVEVDNVVVR
ncbi:HEAT repeat domain-containing protein [candidate division KSB1 bacterium]